MASPAPSPVPSSTSEPSALIRRQGARALLAGAAATTLLTTLSACGGGSSGPLAVSTPSPARQVVGFCATLHEALPERLDGRPSTPVDPTSPLTSAWGDPPVVLRCGVPKPAGLLPTSELIEIDHVRWFLRETGNAFVFTTFGREAYVQVRVPSAVPRERATGPLVDLARPVELSVPTSADFSEGP